MTGPIHNVLGKTGEHADDGWYADDDDIFACVADTTKQPRPAVFDPEPATEPAEVPGVSPLPGGVPLVAMSAPVRVLLADDDPMLEHILGYQLAQLEWQVSCSGDGNEVQRMLRDGLVDVLLIDLNLPHRNAYEILEQLEGRPDRPRVLVMSEQVQEEKIIRAFKLGADDFVAKPFNPRVVLSRLQRLLKQA